VPLLHPSSCHLHSRQFADDCDNKSVDNSSGDDHNDVDVRNCYRHDNFDLKRSIVFHDDYPCPLILNHQHGRLDSRTH
jgi:hypothetical protein